MSRIVVFGGSGVIGRGVLEAASADASIAEVRALQRQPVAAALPRVVGSRVDDFADLSVHRGAFAGADACIFALGISSSLAPSEAEYRRITIDFALEASRRLAEASPRARFVFVSGQGSDPTGRSRFLFARAKGEAENRLREERAGRLVIARPAGVLPERWPREPRWSERMMLPALRLLEPVAQGLVIRSLDLGRALLRAALDPAVPGLLTNRELRRLSA